MAVVSVKRYWAAADRVQLVSRYHLITSPSSAFHIYKNNDLACYFDYIYIYVVQILNLM